jgi:uncharacterized alkaline shock family protein YloU
MNVFNRIFMILLSLVAIAFSVIVFLLVGGVIQPAQVSPGEFLLGPWRFFAQLNSTNATIAVVILVLVVIAALILLIFEFNIFRRKPAQLVVHQDKLGQVTVALSSVLKLVGYEAAAIPGVVETRQEADKGPEGLRVNIRALLLPEVNAPEVGHTLQERIQKSIQTHIGLPVAEVQVATQLEPFGTPRRPRVH